MKTVFTVLLVLSSFTAALPASDRPPAKTDTRLGGHYSGGIDEIVRMNEAGIGSAVVLEYIENSGMAYKPSAEDIVRLHDAGISSDIISALIRQGGKVRAQQATSAASPAYATSPNAMAAPAAPSATVVAGYLYPPKGLPRVEFTVPVWPTRYSYYPTRYSYYYPSYHNYYPRCYLRPYYQYYYPPSYYCY